MATAENEIETTSHNATSNPGRVRWALLAILATLSGWFLWPSLTLLSGIYGNVDDYSHGFLIPLMSAYAAYEIWKEKDLRHLAPSWFGLPILVTGAFIVVIGHWYNIALMPGGLGVGFIVAWGIYFCVIGGVLMAGGPSSLKTFFFPVAYLFFAIPFPLTMTLPLTLRLREIVSVISEKLIDAVGITIFREGNVLHLANASLGVEDACSGIRSFWMLMAIAAALAYVIRMGRIEAIVLCLLATPVSVLMNILRVVATGMLVQRFGIAYASGWRHDLCGWTTFAGGLAVIFGIGTLMSAEASQAPTDSREVAPHRTRRPLWRAGLASIYGVVAGVLVLGLAANHAIANHYKPKEDQLYQTKKPLTELPERIGTFTMLGTADIGERQLDILDPSDYAVRFYKSSENEVVQVRLIYWNPVRYRSSSEAKDRLSGVSGHIPDNCFPAWGYERMTDQDIDASYEDVTYRPLSIRTFSKAGASKCVLFWYEARENVLQSIDTDIAWRFNKLLESWRRPFSQTHASQYVVTIVVDVRTDVSRSREVALTFAEALARILPEYGME